MNILDQQRKTQIFSSFEKTKEVEKAYTEGIYCDSPANRKLGRVGMSYSAYANKVNGSTEGDIGDFKKGKDSNGQTEYTAKLQEKIIKIYQEGPKKEKYWVIEKEGEKILNDKGEISKFNRVKDAINKIYILMEEEKSGYKFPSPDYLEFKGILWKNPDTSDKKISQIHIHKYGKRKPEIRITAKNGFDQTNILLKNSEMKKLLEGIAKKENVSLTLDNYTEEEMQNWAFKENFDSKEITLNYDAEKETIEYNRIPTTTAYQEQHYTFPASALDRVVEQFKKEK